MKNESIMFIPNGTGIFLGGVKAYPSPARCIAKSWILVIDQFIVSQVEKYSSIVDLYSVNLSKRFS